MTSGWDDWSIPLHGPERVPELGQPAGLTRMTRPPTDRSDRKVAGKTRTGTEGSGMERADPDADDWGQAGRRRSSWAVIRVHGADRAPGRAWEQYSNRARGQTLCDIDIQNSVGGTNGICRDFRISE